MIHLRLHEIRKARIPLIVWLVVASTFMAIVGEFSFMGRTIAGWAWVIPLVYSVYIIFQHPSRISYPIKIWLPWICIVIGYFLMDSFEYIQRNMMLISPLVVGMAVSTERIREAQVRGFLSLSRFLLFMILISIVVKTGMLFTGMLPVTTGYAAQSMTTTLLCCIFAAGYSSNRKKDLFQWIIGTAVPIISVTRTAIIAVGSTIPFTFAPLGIKKRLIFLTIVAVLSVTLFYTDRLQRKMFYSGEGTLQDIRLSNPDLFTSGRSHLWDLMIEQIRTKPLWGHGPNASEEYVFSMTWGTLRHPHNDWIRLLYDYGFLGTSVFAFCLVLQVIHLLRRAKQFAGESRILIYAGASSFLPFILFMFTDNIILYAAFFGNLQLTIIGLAYSARKTREIDTQNYLTMLFGNKTANKPAKHLDGENGFQKITDS